MQDIKETYGIGPWCSWCDGQVRRDGRSAVHTATGQAVCADGKQTARATMVLPSMRAEAKALEEEFEHRWRISTDLGIFYCVRAGTQGTRVPVEAAAADELRAKLRARESVDEWAAKDRAARDARLAAERVRSGASPERDAVRLRPARSVQAPARSRVAVPCSPVAGDQGRDGS